MRREIRGGTVTLRGLIQRRHKRADGTLGPVRWYVRIKGRPLLRLPDLPTDHPDFIAAWLAAQQGAPVPRAGRDHAGPGTLRALCQAALRSERFRAASASYRATLRRNIDAIMVQAGGALAADLRPHHIEADITALPGSAPATRLKAWRFVCGFGKAAGLLQSDPSLPVRRPRASVRTEGYPQWTAAEIEAFRARWPVGTAPRLCFEVLLWSGARISDAVALGPGQVGADGVLAYRQTKTGEVAYVPWRGSPPAWAGGNEALHAALATAPRHMTFLATQDGRSRSAKSLGTLIRWAAGEAGVRKSAHGLRKSRAAALAEGGATAHQIAAWTGHQTLAEVERYTRAASRRRAVTGTEQDRNSGTGPAQSGTG